MDHFNCNMTDAASVDQLTTEIDEGVQKLDLSVKSARFLWSDAQSGGHSLSSGSPLSDSVWGLPGYSSPNSSSSSPRFNANGGRIVGAGGGHGPLSPRQENLPQVPKIGKNNRMGVVSQTERQQQQPSPIQPPARFQQQSARQQVASAQQRLQQQNQHVPQQQPMCMHQHPNGFYIGGNNHHNHPQEADFENPTPPGHSPFVIKYKQRRNNRAVHPRK